MAYLKLFFFPAFVLILGILITQILSTVHVYLSNINLYHTLEAINSSGYLPVPNQRIMHELTTFNPAFFGGLFFSLSIGAGLSVITIVATWVWKRFFYGNKLILILFFLLWAGCLAGANANGFNPKATLYFVFTPAIVCAVTARWMPEKDPGVDRHGLIIYILPILILSLLWTYRMDRHLFTDIRNHLLLSNPIGKKINAFYYTYTLYPAEAFKSFDQKMLKTCNLESVAEQSVLESIERELLNHDYLTVSDHVPADLVIIKEGDHLIFKTSNRIILRTTLQDFMSAPTHVLKEFSKKSDRNGFFRSFSFFSLLFGFPVVLYTLVHALFCFVFLFFFRMRTSCVVASIICFLIGTALLVPLVLFNKTKMDDRDLVRELSSNRWQTRVEALKVVKQKGLEIGNFRAYQTIRISRHVPEIIWFVTTLGISRRNDTYKDLITFLDFPDANVVCAALSALAQRGRRDVIDSIIHKIETSDNWYVQWYAYKALKALGWKQIKLN